MPALSDGAVALRLPFDGEGVRRWLAARLVRGVEELAGGAYRRTLGLPGGAAVIALELGPGRARAEVRTADPSDHAAALGSCRALIDADADPAVPGAVLAGDPALAPRVAANPGLRVPGTVDPAETAVRAVLGQHVSLAAARTFAGRLVAACGARPAEPDGALTHLFPGADRIAEADLRCVGVPRARERTLRELTSRLADGTLRLDPGGDAAAAREALLAVPGIGPWTAEYIALRALGDRDAFPAGDAGLQRGARALGLPANRAGLGAHAERWRPWRAYAAHHLWTAGA